MGGSRGKIQSHHVERGAFIYVRQSSLHQVKHNAESKRRQYERADWALQAGWSRDQIDVVDDDQGVTGSLPRSRPGFARMVAAVAAHEAGIVISLEGARLARNGPDWSDLLFLCRWTDTLIADEDGVYDMTSPSDRMVLGIRGQVSQLEIDTSIRRMVEATWSKARRGELMRVVPAGYEIDDHRKIVQTPDESVANAIHTVFAKFDELGSARQVWKWWAAQGLEFPVRSMKLRSHPVHWKAPTYRAILATLKNPIYAGTYIFGRTRTIRELDGGERPRLRVRRVRLKSPAILIQDRHFAYVSWERFQEIGMQIRANLMAGRNDEDSSGAARDGRALLQGLVRCGACGRRMYVNYGGSRTGAKHRTPQYVCSAARSQIGADYCQVVGSHGIDQAVIESFLEVIEPAGVEVLARAESLAEEESEESFRVWETQIERAEYEAARAKRQYMAVEPENRLVARTLERQWNESLEDLSKVHRQAQEARSEQRSLDDADREKIRRLAHDLDAVWAADTTTNRDRKSILRCLIEEVQLRSESDRFQVRIVWKGDATTDRELIRRHRHGPAAHATSEETIELVRKLALEFDDTQIARILNKQGRRSGIGNPFTKLRIMSLRGKNKIPKCPPQTIRDPREGPFTADEAADELGVCSQTIHRWIRAGLLAGTQVTPGAPWKIRLTDEVRRRLTAGEAPEGWISLTEAARRLGISKSLVAYRVKTGKIPAIRTVVGNRSRWQVDVSAIGCGPQADLFEQMRSGNPEDA